MAQAKAQTKASKSQKSTAKPTGGAAKPNSRGTAKPNSRGAKARGSSASGRAAAQRPRSSRSRPSTHSRNGRGATQSIKETATSQAQGVADAAQKAKTPLIAGGATIAGVAGAAGAVALALRSSGRRKVLGIPVGRRNGFKLPGRSGGLKREARKLTSAVADAAKRADGFGQRLSKVASTVHQVSETAGEAAKKA